METVHFKLFRDEEVDFILQICGIPHVFVAMHDTTIAGVLRKMADTIEEVPDLVPVNFIQER